MMSSVPKNEVAATNSIEFREFTPACDVSPQNRLASTAADEPGSSAQVVSEEELESPPLSASRQPFLFPLRLLQAGNHQGWQEGSPRGEEILHGSTEVDEVHAPAWWLVHTKPRQEKKLAEYLRLRSIGHYLPVTRQKALTRGRPRFADIPLFASYLFLHANRVDRLIALESNRTVMIHPVSPGAQLASHLWNLAILIESGAPLTREERIKPGQKVRVRSGPFRDVRGTVHKRAGQTRLFVYVSEMLGGASVEVEQHLLEPYD